MPTYSANDIVGKTLIAKRAVSLKREPADMSATIYTTKMGETVGVVYSYVTRNGVVWWMFYDQNHRPYYAKQEVGVFDVGALNAQGANSLESVQEQKEAAADPLAFYANKLIKPVVWTVVAYFVFKAVLDLNNSKR